MQDADILAESWGTSESDGRQVSWLSHFSLSRSPRICTAPQLRAQLSYRIYRRRIIDSQAQRTNPSRQRPSARIKDPLAVRHAQTTRSFANFSSNLLTHHSRIRYCRGFVIVATGSMTIDAAVLGARVDLGLILRACSACGRVCTYLFPLRAFS